MRNLGYSIFDIFQPIAIAVFFMGLFFLLLLNPLSVFMENKYDVKLDNKENSLYSIKVSDNEMWIKNEIDQFNSSFINIKNINLKNMNAKNIKILLINKNSNKFIIAENGKIENNMFLLNNVKYYDFRYEKYQSLEKYNLSINFSKDNILKSISKYKLVPFYNYINHSRTLSKFNLYSAEIGLFYLSEILKPIFVVIIAFVIVGFTCKISKK